MADILTHVPLHVIAHSLTPVPPHLIGDCLHTGKVDSDNIMLNVFKFPAKEFATCDVHALQTLHPLHFNKVHSQRCAVRGVGVAERDLSLLRERTVPVQEVDSFCYSQPAMSSRISQPIVRSQRL